jgi:hypothetical protein
VFLVRSQVRHTGFELTQADDAAPLPPQMARFPNTQPLAYDLRRSPAELSHQNCESLPRSVIQPCLNCKPHAPLYYRYLICMTQQFQRSCGLQPIPTRNLARAKSQSPMGDGRPTADPKRQENFRNSTNRLRSGLRAYIKWRPFRGGFSWRWPQRMEDR